VQNRQLINLHHILFSFFNYFKLLFKLLKV